MDIFYIEYRDPLFSVLILFGIIFAISFANYFWGIFKSNEEKQSIERFIKRFEIKKQKDAYKEILSSFKLSNQSLDILANSYVKSGDFEIAIEIYLIALNQAKNRDEKQLVLANLGKAYFKAGFLQRSSEVFLESLRYNPRDKTSLKFLTVCYESLKTYDLALEALDSLEELGIDVSKQKAYLKALLTLSDNKLTDDKKITILKSLKQDFIYVDRMLVEFKKSKQILQTKDLDIQNPKLLFDLVWYLNEPILDGLQNSLYKSINAIKNDIGVEQSNIFELEVLYNLKQNGYKKAGLSFEYICTKCKASFPIFFYRCPSCHEICTANIQAILTKKNNETYLSFQ